MARGDCTVTELGAGVREGVTVAEVVLATGVELAPTLCGFAGVETFLTGVPTVDVGLGFGASEIF